MNAIILEGLQQPLNYRDIADPAANGSDVIVRLKAAALNRRDLGIKMAAVDRQPSIMGSDGAGIVEAVGPDADPAWLGSEVIINPSLDWGDDPRAQGPNYRILGLPDYGTFAEKIRIPATYLYNKPAYLTWEEAASLPLAALTAHRALFVRAQLQPGETVLITGIGGGAALFGLQLAKAAGARVFVTSGSDEKLVRAIALGAVGGVNYNGENWVEALREQSGGFDVTMDSAGGDGFAQLVDLAKPGGRIVFFGKTQGDMTNVSTQAAFWKQLSLLGTTMGTPENFADMVSFYTQHQLRPVIDTIFPLAEAEVAFNQMKQSNQFGKIVLKISD